RLSSAAHRAAAGTDVVTDLVVLRRRADGSPRQHAGRWEASHPAEVDGGVRPISDWFADHPDLVLGTLTAGSGTYAHEDLSVRLDEPLAPALAGALDRLAAMACTQQLTYQPRVRSEPTTPARSDPSPNLPPN